MLSNEELVTTLHDRVLQSDTPQKFQAIANILYHYCRIRQNSLVGLVDNPQLHGSPDLYDVEAPTFRLGTPILTSPLDLERRNNEYAKVVEPKYLDLVIWLRDELIARDTSDLVQNNPHLHIQVVYLLVEKLYFQATSAAQHNLLTFMQQNNADINVLKHSLFCPQRDDDIVKLLVEDQIWAYFQRLFSREIALLNNLKWTTFTGHERLFTALPANLKAENIDYYFHAHFRMDKPQQIEQQPSYAMASFQVQTHWNVVHVPHVQRSKYGDITALATTTTMNPLLPIIDLPTHLKEHETHFAWVMEIMPSEKDSAVNLSPHDMYNQGRMEFAFDQLYPEQIFAFHGIEFDPNYNLARVVETKRNQLFSHLSAHPYYQPGTTFNRFQSKWRLTNFTGKAKILEDARLYLAEYSLPKDIVPLERFHSKLSIEAFKKALVPARNRVMKSLYTHGHSFHGDLNHKLLESEIFTPNPEETTIRSNDDQQLSLKKLLQLMLGATDQSLQIDIDDVQKRLTINLQLQTPEDKRGIPLTLVPSVLIALGNEYYSNDDSGFHSLNPSQFSRLEVLFNNMPNNPDTPTGHEAIASLEDLTKRLLAFEMETLFLSADNAKACLEDAEPHDSTHNGALSPSTLSVFIRSSYLPIVDIFDLQIDIQLHSDDGRILERKSQLTKILGVNPTIVPADTVNNKLSIKLSLKALIERLQQHRVTQVCILPESDDGRLLLKTNDGYPESNYDNLSFVEAYCHNPYHPQTAVLSAFRENFSISPAQSAALKELSCENFSLRAPNSNYKLYVFPNFFPAYQQHQGMVALPFQQISNLSSRFRMICALYVDAWQRRLNSQAKHLDKDISIVIKPNLDVPQIPIEIKLFNARPFLETLKPEQQGLFHAVMSYHVYTDSNPGQLSGLLPDGKSRRRFSPRNTRSSSLGQNNKPAHLMTLHGIYNTKSAASPQTIMSNNLNPNY